MQRVTIVEAMRLFASSSMIVGQSPRGKADPLSIFYGCSSAKTVGSKNGNFIAWRQRRAVQRRTIDED